MPPKETLVVIADAMMARFVKTQDRGASVEPAGADLVAPPNPKSIDHMTDRLGRTHSRMGPRRSALAPRSDPHRATEDAFAKTLAAHLAGVMRDNGFHDLLIFAPPAFLGALRKNLSRPVAAKVGAEIDRDLVKASIGEIRTQVRKALFPD